MPPKEIQKLQRQINDLTDEIDSVRFTLTRKIGLAAANISAKTISTDIKNVRTCKAGEAITAMDAVYLTNGQIGNDDGSRTNVTATSATVTIADNSNRILIAGIFNSNGDNVTGVTYNGVSMTQIQKVNVTGTIYFYTFLLVAPNVGGNTLQVQGSGLGTVYINARAYFNAKQTSQPDNNGTTNGSSTSPSGSLTPVLNSCILVGFIVRDNVAVTGGLVQMNNNIGNGNYVVSGESSIINPAASTAQSATLASSTAWTVFQISIAPVFGSIIKRTSASAAATADTFLGFCPDAIDKDKDGKVIVEGVVGGFSGLTAGSLYYLSNTTGAISSSAGTVTRKVGIAVSTTEIFITNTW